MNELQRFTECAHSYGSARQRWPVADRALFDRVATTPEGQRVLADAERVDQWLDSDRCALAGPALLAAIGQRALSPPPRRRWLMSAGLAASLVCGFAFGLGQALLAGNHEDSDMISQALFSPMSFTGLLGEAG